MGKIELLERELESVIKKITQHTALSSWRFAQNIENGEDVLLDDSKWEEKKDPNWSLKDGPATLRKWITIPSQIEGINLEGSNICLTFLFPSGVELFIDGKRVYGHRFWSETRANPFPLIKGVSTGEKKLVVFRSPPGEGFGFFWASLEIDKVDRILFELKSILNQIKFADAISKWEKKSHLKKSIGEALDVLRLKDLEERNWNNVLLQIKEAEKKLEVFREFAKKFKVHLIGHAHIDMNWLWDYEDTVDTVLNTFSTVSQLMKDYPDLTFSQSQGHIYSIVEKENPKLFEKVKQMINEGRWEVTANAWVENDLNISDGESIVRHILYTREYTKEKLGKITNIMWSPDTFGHPATLPTILKGSGIKHYYFWRCGKGLPLFLWRGRDGSEIMAFESTTGYNNNIDSEVILPFLINFYDRCRIKEAMFVYGVGDHGGGPTRMDIERKKRLDEKPLIPTLTFSTTEKFFSVIEKFRSKLPVVEGELNTVFEGCYTTHSDIKKANRESENLLLSLEAFSSIARIKKNLDYPSEEMEEMWKTTLFSQFHDIIDGCAISTSYNYSVAKAKKVIEKSKELIHKTVESMMEENGEESIYAFNSLGWERSGLVEYEVPAHLKGEKFYLEGKDGEKIPVERDERNCIFYAKNIPPFGYRNFLVKKGEIELKKEISEPQWRYENPFYFIEIDQKMGLIRRLYDKKYKKEVINPCKAIPEDSSSWRAETSSNLLKVLWEKPHPMSAWIIGNIYRVENLIDAEKIEIEDSFLRKVFTVFRKYRDSTLKQRIILYPNSPIIDFECEVDWKEEGGKEVGVPMVKVNFNFNMEEPKPFFEIPYGVIQRKNSPREYPALKWGALKERNYWTGIINREKYGYSVDGNNLSLTILRNTYEPDTSSDIRYQKVSYRLYFGRLDELQFTREAMEFNTPVIAKKGKSKGCGEFSSLKINGNVMVNCLKASMDGKAYILRLTEMKGKKEDVAIQFTKKPRKAYLTNLTEEAEKKIDVVNNTLKLTIRPYTIEGIKLYF